VDVGDAARMSGMAEHDPSAGGATVSVPVRVFISYSHSDDAHRRRLDVHLAPLRREGLIATWHDRKILPGAAWAAEIDQNLANADIILLLVSADFVASDYCYEQEMRFALERHERHAASVLPIIVGPVDLSHTPFAGIQAAPLDAKPVSLWANPEEAWLDVARTVRRLVEQISGASPPASDATPTPARSMPASEAPSTSARSSHSSAAPPSALRLVRARLPRILAHYPGDPDAVLMRTELPASVSVHRGATKLDRWTHICSALGRMGKPGFVFVLRIVDDVQVNFFSEELSRWSADFVETLAPVCGGDGGDDLVVELKRFVVAEENRWREIREMVLRIATKSALSSESIAFVEAFSSVWRSLVFAIAGIDLAGTDQELRDLIAGGLFTTRAANF
jgi:hypothetical protein